MKSLPLLIVIVLLVYGRGAYAAGGKPPKTAAKEKAPTGPLPSFDLVTKQVKQVLALDSEYREGDLLTAPKVERILAKLEQIHWKVADAKEIIKLVLPESDWMATRLLNGEGRQFMRRIAALPGGYDRVDRLRYLPEGERVVTNLLDGPDGYTMIEYMTTTRGGKNLGDYLSEDDNGAEFNKRTGRIYTEKELLKRLKVSYDAEEARRHGQNSAEATKAGKPGSKSKSSKSATKTSRARRAPPPEPAAEEPMLPPEDSVDAPPQP